MFGEAPIRRPIETNGHYATPSTGRGIDDAGVRRLIADIIELAELQARLVASDTKCLLEAMVRPIVYATVAAILALGALPVLLLAGASALVEQFDWSPALARLAAGGSVFLVAAILGGFGLKALRACDSPLTRSSEEFEKNMSTLRELVTGSSSLQSHLKELERENQAGE